MFQSSSKLPPSKHLFRPSWAHTERALLQTLKNTNKIKLWVGYTLKLKESEDKFWESLVSVFYSLFICGLPPSFLWYTVCVTLHPAGSQTVSSQAPPYLFAFACHFRAPLSLTPLQQLTKQPIRLHNILEESFPNSDSQHIHGLEKSSTSPSPLTIF